MGRGLRRGDKHTWGSGTTHIATEQQNRRHLEICVKKLKDEVYRNRDTCHIGGDWTMNGVRYDNYYVIWCYYD